MAEGLVNYTRLDDAEETIVTTQGRPISPDDEIRVVDDAKSFTVDGFYRAGDIVRVTETGHIVVGGRAKDQINRGGEKIAAEEIENHILAHPAVHDANVVAVPDAYLGERTCAYVILREGAEPVGPVAIRKFVRERGLAAYKVPDRVEFVDDFPQTGVGKNSKKDLRSSATTISASTVTTEN